MSNLAVHFSSFKQDWETPDSLFNYLDRIYKFDVDLCAHAGNAKMLNYIPKEVDSLKQSWHTMGTCWLNPPYKEAAKWLLKAYEEAQKGGKIVCLIPARTDTKYWHSYAMKAKEIYLIKGRLKFKGAKHSAPFPSAVLVFEKSDHYKPELFTLEVPR